MMIDKKAIRKYHERVDERLAKRGLRFDGNRWQEDKHPRDENGRFTSGSGVEKKSYKISSAEMTKADVKVNGPEQTKAYVNEYFKKHPEVKKEVKKYKGVLENVRDFNKKFPNAENYNSYDPVTGEKMETTDGYIVTFHQNYKIGDEYGAYDDDSYAAMCAIAVNELKPEQTYIGYYDTIEISFNCADLESAKKFAIEHNQHTVYDSAKDSYWYNPFYDKEKNPLKMTSGE